MTTDALIHEVTLATLVEDVRQALSARRAVAGERIDKISGYALLPPGKLLRPLLLVAAAEAVGGSRAQVMPAALAVEYLHIASLVHDGIIDGDDLRRGRASVHARYGIPDAIVTGDALLFGLFSVVAECGQCGVSDTRVLSAVRVLARAGEDLCRGQVREALLVPPGNGGPGNGLEASLEMAALKTGALFRRACRAGAVLGGGSPVEVDVVTAFAEHAGLAFQMYGGPADRRRVELILLARARAREEASLATAGLGALLVAEAAGLLRAVAEVAVRRGS